MELMGTSPKIDLYSHPLFLRMVNEHGFESCDNARKLAVTYGFKRWPALVFFRDGKYLGAVDGLRLWADLVREADEIMHSEPHYPPSVGIPVRSI